MLRQFLATVVSLVFIAGLPSSLAVGEQALLFPYFNSNGENGVFLAWSEDGRTFYEVNQGKPIFTPPKWDDGQHLTRDPSIVYHDGMFHMVWTSNWSGRWLGYSSSPDLIDWSKPKQIQPFPEGHEQPKNVWPQSCFTTRWQRTSRSSGRRLSRAS